MKLMKPEIKILPADETNLQIKWKVHETIGIGITTMQETPLHRLYRLVLKRGWTVEKWWIDDNIVRIDLESPNKMVDSYVELEPIK